MRIVFAGGGTGGHIYPILAVIEALKKESERAQALRLELYYLAPTSSNTDLFNGYKVTFKRIPAGKIRKYGFLLNGIDFFKTGVGIIFAFFWLFVLYPDVVFGKGGYGSFPTLFAARILRIPVIIHESDTIPGRVNKWAGKFAKNIAVSWKETVRFFPKEKTAFVGQPIRNSLLTPLSDGKTDIFFEIKEPSFPVLGVVGGSQGALRINDFILDIIMDLLPKFHIIHQTGSAHFDTIKKRAEIIFGKPTHPHYTPVASLNEEGMRRLYGRASIIISRAGSIIFELATSGIPSILIPIPESISHDQRTNAYAYAREGGCRVIEEENLTKTLFLSELAKISNDPKTYQSMKASALLFSQRGAAETIAQKIVEIATSHEQ